MVAVEKEAVQVEVAGMMGVAAGAGEHWLVLEVGKKAAVTAVVQKMAVVVVAAEEAYKEDGEVDLVVVLLVKETAAVMEVADMEAITLVMEAMRAEAGASWGCRLAPEEETRAGMRAEVLMEEEAEPRDPEVEAGDRAGVVVVVMEVAVKAMAVLAAVKEVVMAAAESWAVDAWEVHEVEGAGAWLEVSKKAAVATAAEVGAVVHLREDMVELMGVAVSAAEAWETVVLEGVALAAAGEDGTAGPAQAGRCDTDGRAASRWRAPRSRARCCRGRGSCARPRPRPARRRSRP